MAKATSGMGAALRRVFAAGPNADWDELEESLIMADVGAATAAQLVADMRSAARGTTDAEGAVRAVLTATVDAGADRSLDVVRHGDKPAVVLMVGVNGTGKTTTVGKLARALSNADKDVLLGAADTFRAAAAEQLMTWGERSGVPVIRGAEGADPAAVAHDAVTQGINQEVDVVLIDTAGRLHTKQGLMDELGKVHRVVSRAATVTEVLLVIDATTGQNGLNQARVFGEVVPLTGVVLTKMDGTAKGGIVIAVQKELGVPVKLVGLGEGADDLVPFEPQVFVDGLVG
jgi:fused signal recognition particle receptor